MLSTTESLEFSPWSDWTECSVTCGAGVKSRGRTCDVVHNKCNGPTIDTRSCSSKPCVQKSMFYLLQIKK